MTLPTAALWRRLGEVKCSRCRGQPVVAWTMRDDDREMTYFCWACGAIVLYLLPVRPDEVRHVMEMLGEDHDDA